MVATGRAVAGGEQLAQHAQRQCGCLLDRPAVQTQQGLQRFLDVAVSGIPGQVVEAMGLADSGEAPADRVCCRTAARAIAQSGRVARPRTQLLTWRGV